MSRRSRTPLPTKLLPNSNEISDHDRPQRIFSSFLLSSSLSPCCGSNSSGSIIVIMGTIQRIHYRLPELSLKTSHTAQNGRGILRGHPEWWLPRWSFSLSPLQLLVSLSLSLSLSQLNKARSSPLVKRHHSLSLSSSHFATFYPLFLL